MESQKDYDLYHQAFWHTYTENIVLDKTSLHIFRIPTSAYEKIADRYFDVISVDEVEKSSRFVQEEDMKRYIIGKFYLRIILSKIVLIKPSAIVFSYTKNRKPYLLEHEFNISHSGNFVVIAISPLPVGIDIEFIKEDFEYHSILNDCFTPLELSQINTVVDFYTFWTRKEAILKATAEGLIDNLQSIDCSTSTVYRNNLKLQLLSSYSDNNYMISLATIYDPSLCYNYWSFEM